MNDGNVNLDKATRFVPQAYYERLSGDRRARPGDILLSVTGSLGIAAPVITDEPFVFQRHIAVLRPDRQAIDGSFLLYFLRSSETREGLVEGSTGTAQMTIALGTLRRFPISLPPLAEQRRIVTRIEALFVRTRRARADLERIAPLASRYERAVRDEVLQAGQDAGWPVRTLGEVASDIRNGIAAKPSHEPPGIRILRISAVRQGRVALDDNRFHQPAADGNTGKYLLNDRDLLFIRFNGNPQLVAACGMVRNLDGECVYPDKLICMRLDQRFAMPEYIEMAAGSGLAREQLVTHIKTAAGQHGISGSDLKTLRLPIPDTATQAIIAATVASKRTSCLFAEHEASRVLALLDRLEQNILARAFRGELVPQDPTEAAEAVSPAGQGEDAPITRRGRPRAAAA